MSFTQIRKRSGPRTEPLGTPALTDLELEIQDFTTTR